MLVNFKSSFAHILRSEGGFGNDRFDRGGATNLGITQAVYNSWRQLEKLPAQSVRLIHTDEALAIYKKLYWDQVDGDSIPVGPDYAIADYAVNSGPRTAALAAQRVLNGLLPGRRLVVDGVIGPATIAALGDVDPRKFINALCASRMTFLKRLRNWWHFGVGWSARVIGRYDKKGRMIELGVLQVATNMVTQAVAEVVAATPHIGESQTPSIPH